MSQNTSPPILSLEDYSELSTELKTSLLTSFGKKGHTEKCMTILQNSPPLLWQAANYHSTRSVNGLIWSALTYCTSPQLMEQLFLKASEQQTAHLAEPGTNKTFDPNVFAWPLEHVYCIHSVSKDLSQTRQWAFDHIRRIDSHVGLDPKNPAIQTVFNRTINLGKYALPGSNTPQSVIAGLLDTALLYGTDEHVKYFMTYHQQKTYGLFSNGYKPSGEKKSRLCTLLTSTNEVDQLTAVAATERFCTHFGSLAKPPSTETLQLTAPQSMPEISMAPFGYEFLSDALLHPNPTVRSRMRSAVGNRIFENFLTHTNRSLHDRLILMTQRNMDSEILLLSVLVHQKKLAPAFANRLEEVGSNKTSSTFWMRAAEVEPSLTTIQALDQFLHQLKPGNEFSLHLAGLKSWIWDDSKSRMRKQGDLLAKFVLTGQQDYASWFLSRYPKMSRTSAKDLCQYLKDRKNDELSAKATSFWEVLVMNKALDQAQLKTQKKADKKLLSTLTDDTSLDSALIEAPKTSAAPRRL